MKRYLLILSLLLFLPFTVFGDEAPSDMHEFNITCPAKKICPDLDKEYQSCKDNSNLVACLKYIETLKKLIPIYDCQRPFDHTPEKDYIVPAFWLCNERKLWDYIELLSNLTIKEAQELFSSSNFRSILDGELAEGFYYLSVKREKALKEKDKGK